MLCSSPRIALFGLAAGLLMACGDSPEEQQRRSSRSERYSSSSAAPSAPRDASERPEGSRAADVANPGPAPEGSEPTAGVADAGDGAEATGGPPETTDADVLEAAALRRQAWSPIGTRAQAIRCQAALGEAANVFAPSWYAYDDRANPDTPIRGCERGESESILEALPWGEGRTELCSIGWRSVIRPGSAFPFAGMGVRTAGGLENVRTIMVETRSTGDAFQVTAQLNLEDQETMPCGDERKAPHEKRLTCDGSGEWVTHRLPVSGFRPTWGRPPALDLKRVISLHFQNLPGHEGPLECDFRIVGVE
jgi:hypothetical protein